MHHGTLKKMETLKRGVSDRHDGYAGRTVESMTVRRRCSSWDTLKNVEIERGNADSVDDAEDTTEGVQITEVVGSGELDPPAC